MVALTGDPAGAPLIPPGRAATAAREVADRCGLPVDGRRLLAERAAFTGRGRRGAVSVGGGCRMLPTGDGWAAVSCARPDDPALLGALIEAEVSDDPWPAVAEWLRGRSGEELTERAALLGVAAGAVREPGAPADLPTPGRARAVSGLRVLDFSALWAGPLCAHLLGLLGADVVKVETPSRPDGARGGDAEFYRLLHAGNRSVVLDPDEPGQRRALARLVETADIVVEASRPRALERFGLDAAAAAEAGTIWVSVTAYGRGDDRVGFGDDVAAASGLVAVDERGVPCFVGDAIADPLTGIVAAELALSEPEGGRGALYDLAMSDVVSSTMDTGLPAARTCRSGGRWVTGGGVPVVAPRRRAVDGSAAASGAHTAEVLRELAVS
ncbi:CoA transferase [Saccharopolyspora sp. HNM0983]|uniref:CoA transferase n=1 Tax=Saccharopolyspora montiporae TaxID=2781240 RepID=A0A929FW88_9PSEU|nr:CoA transferase [Saccharopolyspora sp. HNM0983]